MRRQIRLWIGGVSNACDPHFHSKGEGTPVFMVRWRGTHAAFGFAFRFGSSRAMGILPPLSAPKNKEAAGPTIFFEQADPVPPAERVVALSLTARNVARGRQLRAIDSPGPRRGTRVR